MEHGAGGMEQGAEGMEHGAEANQHRDAPCNKCRKTVKKKPSGEGWQILLGKMLFSFFLDSGFLAAKCAEEKDSGPANHTPAVQFNIVDKR